MKYLHAVLTLLLLIVSKRFRVRWQELIDRLDETNKAGDAVLLRIDALRNGGRPHLRRVS